jgi:hypothetical protein
MPNLEIDDDVFAYLQKHALPLVDTPSSTLRRLLNIRTGMTQVPAVLPDPETESIEDFVEELLVQGRTKAAKADLSALVRAKFLRTGENLYLIDYQGQRVRDFSATIAAPHLSYLGKSYSMSDLAQKLLAQVGYSSTSVRGPAHWVNGGSQSVKDLWLRYQQQQRKV